MSKILGNFMIKDIIYTLGYIFAQIITTEFLLKKWNTISPTEAAGAAKALALSWSWTYSFQPSLWK